MMSVSDELQRLFVYYSLEAEGYSAFVPASGGGLTRVNAVHPKVSLINLNADGRKKEPKMVIQLEGRMEVHDAHKQWLISLIGANHNYNHKVWIGLEAGFNGVYVEFPSEGAIGYVVNPFIEILSSDKGQQFRSYFVNSGRYFAVRRIQKDLSEVVDIAFRVMRERTAPIL